MKEIIVIVGTIILGSVLFVMIVGDENSLKSSAAGIMQDTVKFYFEE